MTIKIITVGSKSTDAMTSLIAEYEKRLPSSVRIEWQFLKHGQSADAQSSKQQESENILRTIASNSYCILLDETGFQTTNKKLSRLLFETNKDITIIIGGAHGVSDEVKQKADSVLSLSKLVLPHQIVRLVLIEQIYRSYTIHINHPYHHS
jgi:23S rRNA (pseudouridine1915-N3)-methyltransferase